MLIGQLVDAEKLRTQVVAGQAEEMELPVVPVLSGMRAMARVVVAEDPMVEALEELGVIMEELGEVRSTCLLQVEPANKAS